MGRASNREMANRTLLEALAPIAEAELAYREAADAWVRRDPSDREGPEPWFPELEGPVFLLGTCALVDAVWAIVGEDPLSEIHSAGRLNRVVVLRCTRTYNFCHDIDHRFRGTG